MKRAISILSILVLTGICASVFAETYVTWPTMEPDKCASAWLIKRFVDKDAKFTFIPKGEFVKEGVPFDTPDSEFRRYHNMSTFESILHKHPTNDPALRRMGKIMHEIEIAYWQESALEETEAVKKELVRISTTASSPQECLNQSSAYLDTIYARLTPSRPLLFSSYRDKAWDLWSINADGTGLTKLVATPDDEHAPAVSRNGQMLAYHTNRNEIWLKRKEKSSAEKIVSLVQSSKPVFFPCGTKLAFLRHTFPEDVEKGDIYVTDIQKGATASPRTLTAGEGIVNHVSVSPDGATFVYSLLIRKGGKPVEEIWTRKSDCSSPKQLTTMDAISVEPAWSPDGTAIAFSSNKSGNYDLWLMKRDGTGLRQLTTHKALEGYPAWSPDGKKLAFHSTRSGTMHIWLLDIATGNATQLTKKGKDNREPAW